MHRKDGDSNSVMSQLENLRREIENQNQQTLHLEKEMQDTARNQNATQSTLLNHNTNNNSNNYHGTTGNNIHNFPPSFDDHNFQYQMNYQNERPRANSAMSMRPNTVLSTQHLEKAFEDSQVMSNRLLITAAEICDFILF